MNLQQISKFGLWVGGITLAFGFGAAVGQQAPPTESKGVEISAPTALDLSPWVDDMKGRQLRIRKLTVAPGGIIGLHSHKDRPDVSYILQGNLVEYREGGFVRPRPEGMLGASGKEVTHWLENKGSTPAMLIVADVFKQP